MCGEHVAERRGRGVSRWEGRKEKGRDGRREGDSEWTGHNGRGCKCGLVAKGMVAANGVGIIIIIITTIINIITTTTTVMAMVLTTSKVALAPHICRHAHMQRAFDQPRIHPTPHTTWSKYQAAYLHVRACVRLQTEAGCKCKLTRMITRKRIATRHLYMNVHTCTCSYAARHADKSARARSSSVAPCCAHPHAP